MTNFGQFICGRILFVFIFLAKQAVPPSAGVQHIQNIQQEFRKSNGSKQDLPPRDVEVGGIYKTNNQVY